MSTGTRSTRSHGSRSGTGPVTPRRLSTADWRQILVRTKDEIKADRVGLMAAGLAFYAMLAIFPALIAAITVWGLLADPVTIQETITEMTAGLPQGAADLLSTQLERIAESSGTTLGWTLAAALAGALWSASSGTKGLMNAVNAAYNEPETRGFLQLRSIALALTIGAIFFGLLILGLIAVVPIGLKTLGLSTTAELVVTWGRWPILALALTVGLGVVYRYAPDRATPEWSWLSVGAGAAVVIWLAASAGFGWYVNSFGSFTATYGSIAGVIVLMLWFFLTAFAILLGAELNAETEAQRRSRP